MLEFLGQVTFLFNLLYVVQHLVYFSVLFLTSDHIKLINISLVDGNSLKFSSIASILLVILVLLVVSDLLHVFYHQFFSML